MNLDCFNSIYITQLSVLSFSAAIISKIKDGNNQIYLPTAYWIKPGDDKKNSRKDVKRTDKDFFSPIKNIIYVFGPQFLNKFLVRKRW